MVIIYIFATASALVSALTISACMLSSRISQQECQVEAYEHSTELLRKELFLSSR